MIVEVGGVSVALNLSSTSSGYFIMPVVNSEGSLGASFLTREKAVLTTLALVSSSNKIKIPVMDVDPSLVCGDTTYQDTQGHLKVGIRNCWASAEFCDEDEQMGCITNKNFIATSVSVIKSQRANIRSNTTIAGVTGTLGDCSIDGGMDCIATSRFSSSDTQAFAPSDIREGLVIAGVTGIMPAVLPSAPTPLQSVYAPSPNRVSLSWPNTGAAGYMLIMREGSAVTFNPARTVSYSAGLQGSDRILYVGTATSFDHLGVTNGIHYHYALYAFDANHFYSSTPSRTIDHSVFCSDLAGGTFVPVPADSDYGTAEFCVMKYEARNVGSVPNSQYNGYPWVSINQLDAIAACRSLGTRYDLISNREWLALASNIASRGSNWQGGAAGLGRLSAGHLDNDPPSSCPASADDSLAWVEGNCTGQAQGALNWSQKRTHTISNGAVIWDLAGNVWDLTSYAISDNTHKPYGSANGAFMLNEIDFKTIDTDFSLIPFTDIIPNHALKPFWDDAWDSDDGIGRYISGNSGQGGSLMRGEKWSVGSGAGIFTTHFQITAATATNDIGFRCVMRP